MLINIPDTDFEAVQRFIAVCAAASRSGLPASATGVAASVSDQSQSRATKQEQFKRDCFKTLEKQLGQGFSQFVNLSSIKN